MTADQERVAEEVAAARDELRRAMNKLPFDINTAGSTRVTAWKEAHKKAAKLMERHPMDPGQYRAMTTELNGCGTTDVAALAKGLWS